MAHVGYWDLFTLAAALLTTGVIAGLVAGLLGVGGGIVIVPVLYFMFDLIGVAPNVNMHCAVGTSLATILATGTSSSYSHVKRGGVDGPLLRQWGLPIVIGVLSGSVLAGLVSGQVLIGVFGVIVLVVAVNMAFKNKRSSLADQLPGTPWRQIIGFFIGGFSVMMGIGGGTLGVPTLTLFNYPIRRAVGTSAVIGLIIAVPGTLAAIYFGWGEAGRPPYSLGYVNVIGFLLIIPASVLLAPVGAKLAHTIKPQLLDRLFALFLLITGLKMLSDVL
ncbi:sulfite exporter TauE/SafE family protein [Flexibacterium corallicola]|uniref:sulfite exporter TauE/SafE family protein n=1 Tax=Flexibacterium corallicola TaxID=3037259 RepID=UPI00286F47A2|nr:sulfite exporter TauE/SafE family protein [Pseudovibrio sp. M1P-2-3]